MVPFVHPMDVYFNPPQSMQMLLAQPFWRPPTVLICGSRQTGTNCPYFLSDSMELCHSIRDLLQMARTACSGVGSTLTSRCLDSIKSDVPDMHVTTCCVTLLIEWVQAVTHHFSCQSAPPFSLSLAVSPMGPHESPPKHTATFFLPCP